MVSEPFSFTSNPRKRLNILKKLISVPRSFRSCQPGGWAQTNRLTSPKSPLSIWWKPAGIFSASGSPGCLLLRRGFLIFLYILFQIYTLLYFLVFRWVSSILCRRIWALKLFSQHASKQMWYWFDIYVKVVFNLCLGYPVATLPSTR